MLSCSVQIAAPPDRVFALMSDFPNAAGRVTAIKKMEMLTTGPVGLGTKFKETRVMMGKEATETMEVVEFDPPRSYTLAAYSCGSDYRSTMRCEPDGAGTKVTFDFKSTPRTFFARLCSPLMMLLMGGMLKKCVVRDLEDLRRVAEKA